MGVRGGRSRLGNNELQFYNHIAGTQRTARTSVAGAVSDIHVYAIEWTAKDLRGYIDDRQSWGSDLVSCTCVLFPREDTLCKKQDLTPNHDHPLTVRNVIEYRSVVTAGM